MPNDSARYDAFWATFFGLEPVRLQRAGVNIVRHAQLGNYPGIWFFARGPTVVVSAPDAWVDRLRSQTDRIEGLPGPALLRTLLGRDPARVIGPAYQGCLLPDAFRPVHDGNVRALTPSDERDVGDLRSSCGSEEWEHSALSAAETRFGYFCANRLVAVAGLDQWSAEAGGPGVLSHPEYRGRGYGTAVVSAVVERALAAGKLLLYQTLLEYVAAVGIARRLGFREYARHIAVRLEA